MLTRLLIPVSALDESRDLLGKVLSFDLTDETEIVLILVVSDRDEEAEARQAVAGAASQQAGVRVRWEIARGEDPARSILECAVRTGATLIAMLTRGRTGPPAWMRGSVAERVLRESPVPVLLDSPGAPDHDGEPYRRILVPVDPWAGVQTDLLAPAVVAAARRHGSLVHLLAVVEASRGEPQGVLARRAEAEAYLDSLHSTLGGVAALKRVVVGTPAVEIVLAALDEDLLLICTRRFSEAATALGRTTEAVLRRCLCPVLAVPTRRLPRE